MRPRTGPDGAAQQVHMGSRLAALEPGLVQMGQTNRTTGRTGQLIVFATEISLAAHTGCGDLMKKEKHIIKWQI